MNYILGSASLSVYVKGKPYTVSRSAHIFPAVMAAIKKKFGTVGAVACDSFGNIAAATSTGGMTNKRFDRVGDTPIIGAGNYANNATCAISCTGHGELS